MNLCTDGYNEFDKILIGVGDGGEVLKDRLNTVDAF